MTTEAKNLVIAATGAPQTVAPPDPEHPDPTLVREQLERILGSSDFLGSDRTHRFLRYVVEEALAGRADRIKAFSVAMAAFGRDESFDPQTDPIVRIEAGRLRRSLERYYLVAGTADPVRIDIPKGTYVPEFSWLNPQQSDLTSNDPEQTVPIAAPGVAPPAVALHQVIGSNGFILTAVIAVILIGAAAMVMATLKTQQGSPTVAVRPALPHPAVAVLPFGISGAEQPASYLSSGMTNELIRELSQYSSIFVLGPQSIQRFGPAPDVTVVGAETGVGFVLSGDIQNEEERIRISVQLSDSKTGGVIWAEAYDRDFAVGSIFDLQVEIAREIVRRIAQPQGAIALFDWKRTRGMAPETWEAHDCVLQADELHRRVLPPAQEPAIRACLKRVVEQEPGYADAWAMLALIEIDAARFVPLALQPADSLELAHAAAERAVDLAPDSGGAHLALMMTLFFRGQVEEALAAGQVALRLSPHDPDVVGELGLRHVISGDLDAGMNLVRQAIDLYQAVPVSYRLALALAYMRQGLYQEASDAAMESGQASNFVYWSVLAAIHGKAGRLDKAREAASELLKLYPDFPRWAWTELERRNLAPELAVAMAEGWWAAGLEVSARPDTGSSF
ncbi:MAG: tetratricopeptide repeat protein [Kiloniellales bacterium]